MLGTTPSPDAIIVRPGGMIRSPSPGGLAAGGGAATCLFLVSDGGGFITGQTIHINGGAGYY